MDGGDGHPWAGDCSRHLCPSLGIPATLPHSCQRRSPGSPSLLPMCCLVSRSHRSPCSSHNPPRGSGGCGDSQGSPHCRSLPVSPPRLRPASLPSIIQANPALVAPVTEHSQPKGVGDSTAPGPRGDWWLLPCVEQERGVGGQGWRHLEKKGSQPGAGAGQPATRTSLSRGYSNWKKACSRAEGRSPTCPGAVLTPRVPRVPSLSGQQLMRLRESPVTQEMTPAPGLFPAPPGRALAPLQASAEVPGTETEPGPQNVRCSRARGWGPEPGHRGILPAWPWAAAAAIAGEQPSRSAEETIYKQEQAGAHRPVWEPRLRGE